MTMNVNFGHGADDSEGKMVEQRKPENNNLILNYCAQIVKFTRIEWMEWRRRGERFPAAGYLFHMFADTNVVLIKSSSTNFVFFCLLIIFITVSIKDQYI